MSGGARTTGRLAVVVLAAALALGGCRGTVAPTTGSPAVTSADPLGSVETRVDQIEKQVDHDGTR
jgi:hypothetical protein